VRGALALAALATTLAFAPAAQAQTDPLLGEWVFEAPLEPADGCVITGRATITAGRERGAYSVITRGQETCPAGQWATEQHCVGTRSANTLRIERTLVEAAPVSYVEDHFALEIRGPDLMEGRLLSAREGPAVWRRARAPLVS